jgi:DNA modification methylase
MKQKSCSDLQNKDKTGKNGMKSRERESLRERLAGEQSNNSEPRKTVQIRDRIKELRRVRAGDLVPHAENWRVHPSSQVAALRGVLNHVGYASALIARELPDETLQLIDGHLRAEITPDAIVPVLIVDLDEQEARYVLLTHDPLATMAESDTERLKVLLQSVHSNDDAVNALLEQTAGPRLWASLYPFQADLSEPSPERADELQRKWGTKLGQVWHVNRHRLVCGTSRDSAVPNRLWTKDSPSIRMIWTDPPYGVSYGAKTQWTDQHSAGSSRKPIENDSLKPVELQKLFSDALNTAREHALPGAVVYATVPSVFLKYFIQGLEDGGFAYRHCLVWVKQTFVLGRSDYHYRHEPILYGWLENGPHYFSRDRSQDSVFEIDRPLVSDFHPTTKPVELIARMIASSSRPGELVFDPFAGSGSTILAAQQLGRIGYGCELDPAYLAVQLERLSMQGLEPHLIGV